MTLLELLVVIAIIGILVGLLLSAVQQVRSAAARVDCANRMHQIALALHAYHDAHSRLPLGTASPPISASGMPSTRDSYPLLNWSARVLPYLEHENAWREIDSFYRSGISLAYPPPIFYQLIPIYLCPADCPRLPAVPGQLVKSPLSYVGVSGITSSREDGVLFLESQVRFADITDGLSNTLLFGERPPAKYGATGRAIGGWGHWGSGDAYLGVMETSISLATGCPYHGEFGPSTLSDPCSSGHFWSFHPRGANFAFVDGSVRFFTYGNLMLQPLATRAGGEVTE